MAPAPARACGRAPPRLVAIAPGPPRVYCPDPRSGLPDPRTSPVRRRGRGVSSMRYRHFRNTAPPALAPLWNESLIHRGAVELRSASPLEVAVLNKPYFDPAGLV